MKHTNMSKNQYDFIDRGNRWKWRPVSLTHNWYIKFGVWDSSKPNCVKIYLSRKTNGHYAWKWVNFNIFTYICDWTFIWNCGRHWQQFICVFKKRMYKIEPKTTWFAKYKNVRKWMWFVCSLGEHKNDVTTVGNFNVFSFFDWFLCI